MACRNSTRIGTQQVIVEEKQIEENVGA